MMGGGQSQQAATVRMPHRWPLVQQLYTRAPDIPLTKDARLVNAYAELDPLDETYWVYKRVGVSPAPLYTGPAGQPGGLYYFSNDNAVLAVAGGNLYLGNNLVGAMPATSFPVGYQPQCWFETINSTPFQTIVIQNPYGAVIYAPDQGSFNQILDPNYPAFTVPGLAYLNGTLYVMDALGGIHGSASTNAAGAWDPLNLIKASSRADLGVFLTTQLSYVVAFKQWTTQIFYDAQNPVGSPLGPVPDAQIAYGCLHANSVQKIDEILLWVTSNQTISPQVMMMENLSPKVISTPSIERLLDNLRVSTIPPGPSRIGFPGPASNTIFYSFSMKHGGHRFYGLTHTTMNFTIVYDLDQKLWYQWTDANGNFWPMINCSYVAPTQTADGLHLAQALQAFNPVGEAQGNVYTIDGDYNYPNDMGNLFAVDIYTPNFDGGTKRRKVLNMMYFSADQTPGSILQARYSDNDYRNWTNFRSVDLNQQRPYLDEEGTFTKRAYHFRHRCNTSFRIKSSDLQLDLGTI